MKSIFFYFIIFFSVSLTVKGQSITHADTLGELINPQTIMGKAFYNMTWIRDTSNKTKPYHEEFELDYGKTMSCYFSYYAKLRDIKVDERVQKNWPVNVPKSISTVSGFSGEGNQIIGSRDLFFTDNNDVDTRMMYIWSSQFLIKDTNPKINWKILDSTKNIKGYLCQKAMGESHGRNYTAWFCNDIPYNFGPRRLHGLPGLILEAYDSQYEIVYTLEHIENGAKSPDKIGIPKRAIVTTDYKFKKALGAYEKNPASFDPQTVNSNTNSFTVKGANSFVNNHYDPKKFIPNNPIDLK